MSSLKFKAFLTLLLFSSITTVIGDSKDNCSNRNNNYDLTNVRDLLALGQQTPGNFKPLSQFPCWFDVDLARIGQEFARRHFGQLFIANTLAAILLFSHRQVQPILLLARANDTLRQRSKGDLATAQQIYLWYHEDILSPEWFRSVQNIRRIHFSVSQQIKIRNTTNINNPSNPKDHWRQFTRDDELWKAFYLDLKQLDTPQIRSQIIPFNFTSPHKFNQYVLAMTHWFFMALPILHTDQLGISNYSQRDLQGFAHLWATIAYNIGIEDEFVFCKNTIEQWEECVQYLKFVFSNHYLPQMLGLNYEGELLIQGQVEVIKKYIPGIPLEFWLLLLLENHMSVNATHLRKHQGMGPVAPAAFGSLIGWFANEGSFDSDMIRWILNRGLLGVLQFASLRLFGNPGTNLTNVARSHYSCQNYL